MPTLKRISAILLSLVLLLGSGVFSGAMPADSENYLYDEATTTLLSDFDFFTEFELPEDSEEPETPDGPDDPDDPDNPEEPDDPDDPECPEEPDDPDDSDAFDEAEMVREAIGAGLFDIMLILLGGTFRHDPGKVYGDFWSELPNMADLEIDLVEFILEYNLGDAAPLQSALTGAGFSHLQATDFIAHIAETFAYQSVQSIRDIVLLEDPTAGLVDILTTPALAADIEAMVEAMLEYYNDIMMDILENFGVVFGDDDAFYLAIFKTPWVVAAYWHNFAEINEIEIPPGTVAPDYFPIKNVELKANLAYTGIVVGFAEAQEIDVNEVEIDPAVAQALLEAILSRDMFDLNTMLHGLLLREGATPEDLLVVVLLSLFYDRGHGRVFSRRCFSGGCFA